MFVRRIALLALPLAGIAFASAACDDVSTTTSDNGQEIGDSRLAAFDVCQDFVRDRLKSPSTAEWRNPFGDQVTYTGDGEGPITVDASVDSENGFGASLRSPYACTVSHASGDTWHLESLDMQDGGDLGLDDLNY